MKQGTLEHKIQTDAKIKFDVEWGLFGLEHVLAVVGLKNVKFIRANEGNFSQAVTDYGVTDRKHMYDNFCICFDEEGNAYSGANSGNLLKWTIVKGLYKVTNDVRAHLKAINSIKC